MIFAHMADTHLGAGRSTGRLDEIIQSFNHAFTEANTDDQVEFILIAGDVFDKVKPSWYVVSQFIRITQTAQKPVYVIAGNHDTSRIRTGGSVWEILEAIDQPLVHYAHGFSSRVFELPDGHKLVATPWGAIQEPKDIDFRQSASGTIWMTHGAADGVQGSHAVYLNAIVTENEMRSYAYVALGDLHTEGQVQSNAWYSGSTDRMNWSDYAARPKWLKVTLEDNEDPLVEEQLIKTREMQKLPPIAAANKTAFEVTNLLEKFITDPEVMYSVNILELDHRERREVKANFKDYQFVRFVFSDKPRDDQYVVSPTDITSVPSLEEMFVEFVNVYNADQPEEFREKIKRYGLDTLAQAKQNQVTEL